jgi:hypothetical protein
VLGPVRELAADGIQPKGAHGKLQPGRCKARVHQRATSASAADASSCLGSGPARPSPTTADNHACPPTPRPQRDLDQAGDLDQADEHPGQNSPPGGDNPPPTPSRYAWELAHPTDPDIPPLAQRLLRTVSERIQRRNHLDQARRAATEPPGPTKKEHPQWTTTR